ncbi:MAG: 50S ribosomal protein L1 [Candidatus Omnitrophica bacterium]|nr:50S ribosomal protein L1 [Candidatus Omnitrophota bacterium]MBU1871811.1 50S ribosomal protein L1 [Candidatus Omnitrophota bacterium]
MKKRSKRYKEATKPLQEGKTYPLQEAVTLIKSLSNTKFDSSVELHFYLNVDPKKADQMVRGTIVLPHGTGKKVTIAVFAKGEQEKQARESGADYAGGADLIEKVSKGFMDFNCAIATPEMMKDLSRLGKVLGPRGLMPSPKTGTVTNDVKLAIEQVRKGKVEYKVDKQGGIHLSVGKAGFTEKQLLENASCLLEAINSARPASIKGHYIKSIFLSSTMGPGLRLESK